MKIEKIILGFLLFGAVFSACKKGKVEKVELTKPTIKNIEIGSGNNEIGFIGQDFHFDAIVTAGEKIETVQINIEQKRGETYAKIWSHEVIWTQYQGVKNTNIHQHFIIPKDAVEGKYDVIITAKDQNGTIAVVKKNISIRDLSKFPIAPSIHVLNFKVNRELIYATSDFVDRNKVLKRGDSIVVATSIRNTLGDGKMYILLINKKWNHKPESIVNIDFSKVIVYDVHEHKNTEKISFFYNAPSVQYEGDRYATRPGARYPNTLIVGATYDNNIPSSPITGNKAWESGDYYLAFIYHNITYNVGVYRYVELKLDNN